MSRHFNNFFTRFSQFTLKNRALVLVSILGLTCLLSYFGSKVLVSTKDLYLLPKDHAATLQHKKFIELFGEDGAQIVIATDGKTISEEQFNLWNQLFKEIDIFHNDTLSTLGSHNLKTIKRDSLDQLTLSNVEEQSFKSFKAFVSNLPFYKDLIYNTKTGLLIGILFFSTEVLNTPWREHFIQNELTSIIDKYKSKGLKLHISGMPYIRTKTTAFIKEEMGWLVGGALLLTSFVFYLLFRSFFPTFISLLTIGITTIWVYGYIGLLGYKITIFTALIPPLIIIIGIPNCIFLINHYLDGIKAHGNKYESLTSIITKVGSITFLTNLTTASSFMAFLFTDSENLQEFGLLASISILSMFLLSVTLVPIFYSFGKKPSNKYLKKIHKKWTTNFIYWKLNLCLYQKKRTFIITSIVVLVSLIGMMQIKTSGSHLNELPKKESFYHDVLFFEKNASGILSYHIIVDTKKKRGVYKPSTLNKIEKLQEFIENIPEFSLPMSLVNVVKFAKQGYYNGNPDYYSLPSNFERSFILSSLKKRRKTEKKSFLSSFTDKDERYIRVTFFSTELSDPRFKELETQILKAISELFPKEQYDAFFSGKSVLFQKGTQYLVQNLFISLIASFIFIFILMCILFRSVKLGLISLLPNILPLLTTSGVMGFLGIPLKPSTVLVFGVALGIAVDDTIHFMARFRQTLSTLGTGIKGATISALKHTASSMLYSSTVLFFGFLIFTFSGFGGTVALGGLVAVTLLVAVLTDLILLPTLLLFWRNTIKPKKL